MADDILRGKQIVNISETAKQGIKNLGTELSGVEKNEGFVGPNKSLLLDHIFTFVGLAGGVGTSTLVANTAYTLKKRGHSVIVIDLNILYPIQHSFFKIKQEIETKDLFSFLVGECRLGEAIRYPSGKDIGVMVANNRGLVDALDADSKDASTALTEGLERLASLFDFVLIDCGNNISNELYNTALYKADRIIAVMDENIECLSNYHRLASAMGVCGIDYTRVKAILNKRTSIQYQKSTFKDFNIDLLAVLPFDLSIVESGLRGELFCHKGASSSKTAAVFTARIKDVAESMEKLGGNTSEESLDMDV